MSNDILSGPTPIVLGDRWFPLEHSGDTPFRWVENDCKVMIAAFHPYDHRLTMELESGPGFDKAPFDLNVFNADDHIVDRFHVSGHQSVTFVLPASRPTMHVLRLHVDGGGRSSPGDDRILNFRVFRISARAQKPDVVAKDSGFRVGAGWYILEEFASDTFRWVSNEAFVDVERAGLGSLTLDVEPGPGVGFKPFTLTAINAEDKRELATFHVTERQTIEIPLDAFARRAGSIQLMVEGGGTLSPGDARILNFRVFSMKRP